MRISESDWNVFLGHAATTLSKFQVPDAEQREVVAFVQSLNPAAIVRRSAGARAEEVDQELLLTHHAVFPAMSPEAAGPSLMALPPTMSPAVAGRLWVPPVPDIAPKVLPAELY
jgi:hypothetical protein